MERLESMGRVAETARRVGEHLLSGIKSAERNELQRLQEYLTLASDNQLVQQFRVFRIKEGLIDASYLSGLVVFGLTMFKAMSEGKGGYNEWGNTAVGMLLFIQLGAYGLHKVIKRQEDIFFQEAETRPTLEINHGRFFDRISLRQLAA